MLVLNAANLLSPVGLSTQNLHSDMHEWKLYGGIGKKERRSPVRHRCTLVGHPCDTALWCIPCKDATEFQQSQTRQGEQNIMAQSAGYMTGLVNDLLYGVRA